MKLWYMYQRISHTSHLPWSNNIKRLQPTHQPISLYHYPSVQRWEKLDDICIQYYSCCTRWPLWSGHSIYHNWAMLPIMLQCENGTDRLVLLVVMIYRCPIIRRPPRDPRQHWFIARNFHRHLRKWIYFFQIPGLAARTLGYHLPVHVLYRSTTLNTLCWLNKP